MYAGMNNTISRRYMQISASSHNKLFIFFFFSSRRRHTRYWRDWSSDVCSSDLHKGVAFPPEYQPRGITITIRGEKLALNRDQEEIVYAWAKKKDTHYVQDPIFQQNFLSDLQKLLPERHHNIAIKDIDFSMAYQLADEERLMKEHEKERYKTLTKEQKKSMAQAKKAERERLKSIYGKAVVDGIEVDVANWLVEPPGLFMGRGQHPMRGR